jgi:hypothetical protein
MNTRSASAGRRFAARAAGLVALVVVGAAGTSIQAQSTRVYELRTYTTAEGRLDALLTRFGGGEIDLFHKHGIESVGYWVPDEAPASANTLVYMIAHESRESAAASWQAFRDDPEWQTMWAKSREDGPIVIDVESVFLDPADFSPLQ